MIVRTAEPADRDRVVATVVAAFRADPAFGYFFPDRTTYADQAAILAGYLFDIRVGDGTVWIADDGASVAMWDGPVVTPRPELMLPADTLSRFDHYRQVVHPAMPTDPHWYLGVLATHPDAAGRRLGRATMAAGLTAAGDMPAYLETSNPANVALYSRAGWQIVTKVMVDELPVWLMTHVGEQA
jgi:GNAT superfamily N-acetyltransferase